MKIEVRGRQTGKTTDSAEWIRAGRDDDDSSEDRLILVPTEQMATFIRGAHRLSARECMSWDTYLARGHGRRPVIRIENAQGLIEQLIEEHFPQARVESVHIDAESLELNLPDWEPER